MIYAQIIDGIVANVIIADEQFIALLPNANEYVILTRGGIGWTFDGTNFIAPQPYPSWTLDEFYNWQPPTPQPHSPPITVWDEQLEKWIPVGI